MSEYGVESVGVKQRYYEEEVAGVRADDEEYEVASVLDYDDVGESVVDFAVLQEEAVNAQRLAVSRNAAEYVRGSAGAITFDPERKLTDEKMFRVSNLIDWSTGSQSAVLDALAQGRVRARVSAAMGMGKSTRLPFEVAEGRGHRVAYVTLDATAISQCNEYTSTTGRGVYQRPFRATQQPWVVAMTYHDFVNNCAMRGQSQMFAFTETFIFDEAGMTAPMVKAAMKLFAVYSQANTNLLLCSATIREDVVGESAGLGNVTYFPEDLDPYAVIESGKLVSNYLTDRTLVVVPSDEVVHDMAEHYEQNGVEVRTLDSAARFDEVNAMNRWMDGDSSTPRVLVVSHKYAVCFNFAVGFLILWPFVDKLVVEEGVVRVERVRQGRSFVAQGVARVGRGITKGANALVMGPYADVEPEMTLVEKVEEYVALVQAYVRPRRTKEWAEVMKVFPQGLDPLVAQVLRKVNLPAIVAARYLGSDGRFAARYTKGILAYVQSDLYVYPSAEDLPVGHEKWVSEKLFGSSSGTVFVPLRSTGELQVVMHAIDALSRDEIVVPRWRVKATVGFAQSFDEGSDQEGTAVVKRRALRRVRSVERPVLTVKIEEKKLPWSYAAESLNKSMGGRGTRGATIIQPDRFEEAIKGMFKQVNDFRPTLGVAVVVEDEQGSFAHLELPNAEVESPGGTVVCKIPGDVAEHMNMGEKLSVAHMVTLVQLFRTYGKSIVGSRLFDNYAKPWDSVLDSFNDFNVIDALTRKGLAMFAFQMLGLMNTRFAMELIATVKNSNVFSKRYMGLFNRAPTADQVMRAIRNGTFTGIAQTNGYIDRVISIKGRIDSALIVAERSGHYLPTHITEAQRTLPIHGMSDVGRDGAVMGVGKGRKLITRNPMSSGHLIYDR